MAMDIAKRATRLTARLERINFCLKRGGKKARLTELEKEKKYREAELAYLVLKHG